MKERKEPKTKTPELEVIDDIFMVEKDSRRLIGLKLDIEKAPENMVIPEGIEIIGKGAFLAKRFHRNNIKSVKFPDSLKKIEEEAFFQCLDLTDIQFGNGLEYIEMGAFTSCRALEKIIFPDSLRIIGRNAFSDCSELSSVVFNEGLQVIEPLAFYLCKKLNEFVLPESLRVVGDESLQYARKVTIHGAFPYNLMRAVNQTDWSTYSEFRYREWPMVVELVTDDGSYFLPKYIEPTTNEGLCECALNSGIPENTQTMHKYCKAGDPSADTAYATYIYLLKSDKEPCEDLKKYVKRMSKSITARLMTTGRDSEAAEFIKLGLLTPAAAKDLYENAVNNNKTDIAAYLLEAMVKNKKKNSMRL